jgi:hypothetical protein
MRHPVVCVDGFSYERESILEWFEQQSKANQNSANQYSSPMTGEILSSNVLFRNINLEQAIEHYLGVEPPVSKSEEQSAPFEDIKTRSNLAKATHPVEKSFLQFSQWSLGKSVILTDGRSRVVRSPIHTDTVVWYEYIAFSAFPARIKPDQHPRVRFQVGKCKTGWGGLTVGLSPTPPDKITVPALTDFVDNHCWWLDGNRWFHTPETGATLVPWSTDSLREGDIIGLYLPSNGRLCVYLNGVKKLDLKDTGIPTKLGTHLYGFVALTGGYEEVCILQDTDDLWPE